MTKKNNTELNAIAFRICFTIMQMFYVASKVDNSQNVQLFFSVAKVNGEKPESNRRNRKKNIKICTLKRMQKATEQSSDEDLRRIFHTICTSSSIGGSIVSRSHASARIIFYSYLDHFALVLCDFVHKYLH